MRNSKAVVLLTCDIGRKIVRVQTLISFGGCFHVYPGNASGSNFNSPPHVNPKNLRKKNGQSLT